MENAKNTGIFCPVQNAIFSHVGLLICGEKLKLRRHKRKKLVKQQEKCHTIEVKDNRKSNKNSSTTKS